MSTTALVIWFVFMAVAIIAILSIGTLTAAGITPRRRGDTAVEASTQPRELDDPRRSERPVEAGQRAA